MRNAFDVLVRLGASLHRRASRHRPTASGAGRGRRVGRAWSCTRRTPPPRGGGQSLVRRGTRASRPRRAVAWWECSSSSSTDVIVRSRNARSCDTIATPPASSATELARGGRARRSRGRWSARRAGTRRSARAGSRPGTHARPGRPRACDVRWSSVVGRQPDVGDHRRSRASKSEPPSASHRSSAAAYTSSAPALAGGERSPSPVRARRSAAVDARCAGGAAPAPSRRRAARVPGAGSRRSRSGGASVTVPRSGVRARPRACAAASSCRSRWRRPRRPGPGTDRQGHAVEDHGVGPPEPERVGDDRRAQPSHFRSVATPHDAQSGPGVVDRAHLVVDEAEGKRDLAHGVLGDVGRHAGCLLRPRDPQPTIGEDRLAAALRSASPGRRAW